MPNGPAAGPALKASCSLFCEPTGQSSADTGPLKTIFAAPVACSVTEAMVAPVPVPPASPCCRTTPWPSRSFQCSGMPQNWTSCTTSSRVKGERGSSSSASFSSFDCTVWLRLARHWA
jgi:hypothetical protein